MRAAMTVSPRQMDLVDLPVPQPGPGQVLLRVRMVGLCGSDVHLFLGDHPYARFPQVQGHEFCGVIEEFGPGYEGRLQPGDLVAVEPLRPCGDCYACRRGHPNCCCRLEVMGAHVPGALAEHVTVPVTACYPAAELTAELAALVEPTSIGLQAVVRSGAGAGDRVLVLGAGPIGQTAALGAADRGAEVMVADRLGNRLDLAARLGAARTVNTEHDSLSEAVTGWTAGDGPAVVIDATGVPALIRQGVDLVAHSGTVVIVGISLQEVALPVTEFTRKELNVLGSRNNAGLFGDAVDLVARHQDRARRLITHRFPFGEAAAAIDFAVSHPEEAEKVLVVMD